ncbi:MAG: hypothetical protein KBA61_08120 [Spirochaetes bacterium]|nr:hypothetical protein [Spirochaetota bacterium]
MNPIELTPAELETIQTALDRYLAFLSADRLTASTEAWQKYFASMNELRKKLSAAKN